MSRLARNFWTSISLAFSDFIGFTIAMYIAIETVKLFIEDGDKLVLDAHVTDWMAFHICLGSAVLLGTRYACVTIFIEKLFGLN